MCCVHRLRPHPYPDGQAPGSRSPAARSGFDPYETVVTGGYRGTQLRKFSAPLSWLP